MAWSRFDDSWVDHPKVIKAGNEAVGLFTRAVAWSSRHLTDGVVPIGAITMMAGSVKRANFLVKVLFDVGLLDHCGNESVTIHDYLEYNPSGGDVRAKRQHIRDVRRQAGEAGGKQTRSKREANAKQTSSPDSFKQTSSPVPVPVPIELQNPSCVLPLAAKVNGSRAGRAPTVPRLRPWPEDLKLTDKHRTFAEQGGLDAGMEWGAFKDHHLAKGSRFADWDRAWQTWCRNAVRFAAERSMGRHP